MTAHLSQVAGAGALWLGLAALQPTPALASAGEVRAKVDVDYAIPGPGDKALPVRPMLRTEQRFRGQGLVLLKAFVGARAQVLPWLKLQAYYAHKDQLGEEHVQVHMLTLDVILVAHAGPLTLQDRSGNEWHSRPGFYRYRNALLLRLDPGWPWLRPFVSEEVRFDSDQRRMNVNDVLIGADLVASKEATLQLYYDLESKRRSSDTWTATHVAGLMVLFHVH